MYETTIRFLKQLDFNCSNLSNSLKELGETITAGKTSPHIPIKVHEKHIKLLNVVIQDVSTQDIDKHTGLTENARTEMNELKEETQEACRSDSIEYRASNLQELGVAQSFADAGMIEFQGINDDRDQSYMLTYYLSPASIPLGLYFLYQNSWQDYVNICESVLALKGEQAEKEDIYSRAEDIRDRIGKPLNDWIDTSYIDMQRLQKFDLSTKELTNARFLPTSNEFYYEGKSFYEGDFSAYNVFSTTTGLILPEEHYGAQYFSGKGKDYIYSKKLYEKSSINPQREEYHEKLKDAAESKPVCYFFDKVGTAKKMEQNLKTLQKKQREKYKKTAKEILASYLAQDSLQFFHVEPKIPPNFQFFTLTNDQKMLISGRPGDDNSIGHGLRATLQSPKPWAALKSGYSSKLGNLDLFDLCASLATPATNMIGNPPPTKLQEIPKYLFELLNKEFLIQETTTLFSYIAIRYVLPQVASSLSSVLDTRNTLRSWKSDVRNIAENYRQQFEDDYQVHNYCQENDSPDKVADRLVEDLAGDF